jgi:hypothetical protein
MKRDHAIKPSADIFGPRGVTRRRLSRPILERAVRDWGSSDGLIWLHLLKTITAGLLALGMAMLLDLPQPRIAMTTVFVLMQPLSGMVLAKRFSERQSEPWPHSCSVGCSCSSPNCTCSV